MARSLADFVREALKTVEEISAEGAAQILEKPDRAGWEFIDVREPYEFAEGHIPGARNFPRGFLEVRADFEHPKRDPWLADRERKMILYCGGGPRSALASKALQEMGFQRILSLAGGWTGWTELKLPVER
jgi:rhodanese-related sulfurtransferase